MLEEHIIDAIASAAPAGPARLKAGVLVETFLAHFERRFGHLSVLGTEVPFYVRIAAWHIEEVGPEMEEVWLAGFADVLFSLNGIPFVQELKTTGKWEESEWLDEIGQSPQPPAEALALSCGTFALPARLLRPAVPGAEAMVSVCAITKTNQPDVWPADLSKSVIEFSPARLARFARYVEGRGRQILTLRAAAPDGPWGWTGPHCALFKSKAKDGGKQEYCRFYDQCCAHDAPPCAYTERSGPETRSDELRRTIETAEGLERGYLDRPNVVVLSPSSLQTSNQCMELYRLTRMAPREHKLSTEIGTATHAGIQAFLQRRVEV